MTIRSSLPGISSIPNAASSPVFSTTSQTCWQFPAISPTRQKAFLADALGKLPDHVAECPQGLVSHVLGGVDAKTIDIGVGDPEAVDDGEMIQGRGTLAVLSFPFHPKVEGLQVEHVALGILREIIPAGNVPFAKKKVGLLELSGPNGAIRPGRFQSCRIGRIKR